MSKKLLVTSSEREAIVLSDMLGTFLARTSMYSDDTLIKLRDDLDRWLQSDPEYKHHDECVKAIRDYLTAELKDRSNDRSTT